MAEVLQVPESVGPVTPVATVPAHDVKSAFRRRGVLIACGVFVAVVLIALGIRYAVWSAGHEETDDAYLQGHVHPVSSRVTGTVQQVLVDDNQIVQSGQLLVELDPRDYQVRIDQAQASLDMAERLAQAAQETVRESAQSATAQHTDASGSIGAATAGIAAARAQVQAAQAGIPKAEADLARARATQQREELDLHRYEDLSTKGQVSRQMVEHAREANQVAVAATAAQEQAVAQARALELSAEQGIASAQGALLRSQGALQTADAQRLEVGVRGAQYSTAQASIAQATAALADAKLQLSYTRITSPVAGKVGRKSVEVGQRLQVGQPLLAVVGDKPWIVANFKETQLEKIRPKQPVEIRIDSFPHHVFRGRVESIQPGSGNQFSLLPPDNATGNFTKIVQRIPVKIIFDSESISGYENVLVPGSSVVVTVAVKEGN